MIPPETHAELDGIGRALEELDRRRHWMILNDIRECDIPACNCGSYHFGGMSVKARYEEVREKLTEARELLHSLRRCTCPIQKSFDDYHDGDCLLSRIKEVM